MKAEELREEIAEIIRKSDCGAPIERYYDDADESISKALDAAVENIIETRNILLGMHESLPAKEQAMLVAGIDESIKAVNKLRP